MCSKVVEKNLRRKEEEEYYTGVAATFQAYGWTLEVV